MEYLLPSSALVMRWKQVLLARPWRSLGDLPLHTADTDLENPCSRQPVHIASGIQLPPPTAFKRCCAARCPSKAGTDPSVLNLDVSLSKPYRIQSISADLAALLRFTPDQLSGRSLCVLQGPETDPTGLCSAIKAAHHLVSTVQSIVLYSRDGRALKLDVEFRPMMDGLSTCGCRMRIRPAEADHPRGNIDAGAHSWAAPERRRNEKELRTRYKAEHRFRTGLEIQRTLNRSAAGCRRAAPC